MKLSKKSSGDDGAHGFQEWGAQLVSTIAPNVTSATISVMLWPPRADQLKCLQAVALGASIIYDQPILVVVESEGARQALPPKLTKVADRIAVCPRDDPDIGKRIGQITDEMRSTR